MYIHEFEMFHWITESNVLLLVVTSNICGLIFNSAEKERGRGDWNTVVLEGSPFLPSPGQYYTPSINNFQFIVLAVGGK